MKKTSCLASARAAQNLASMLEYKMEKENKKEKPKMANKKTAKKKKHKREQLKREQALQYVQKILGGNR